MQTDFKSDPEIKSPVQENNWIENAKIDVPNVEIHKNVHSDKKTPRKKLRGGWNDFAGIDIKTYNHRKLLYVLVLFIVPIVYTVLISAIPPTARFDTPWLGEYLSRIVLFIAFDSAVIIYAMLVLIKFCGFQYHRIMFPVCVTGYVLSCQVWYLAINGGSFINTLDTPQSLLCALISTASYAYYMAGTAIFKLPLRTQVLSFYAFVALTALFQAYLEGFIWVLQSVDYVFQIVIGILFPFIETVWKYFSRWLTAKSKDKMLVALGFIYFNAQSTIYFIVYIVLQPRNDFSFVVLLLAKSCLLITYFFKGTDYYWNKYINHKIGNGVPSDERKKIKKMYHLSTCADFLHHTWSDLFVVISFYPLYAMTRFGPAMDSYPDPQNTTHELLYPAIYFALELTLSIAVYMGLRYQAQCMRTSTISMFKIVVLTIEEECATFTLALVASILLIFVYNSLSL